MDRNSAGAPGNRTRSFTLIELLVVVAIISILASMLLPAIQKARAKAHASLCSSNLNQFGKAVLNYVDEYGNFMPPHWNDATSDNWHRGVFIARAYYKNNFKLLRCPRDLDEDNFVEAPANEATAFPYVATKHYSSFNYNMKITDDFALDRIGAGGLPMICREKQIIQPSTTIIYLEGDAPKAGLKNASEAGAFEAETDGPKPSWWATGGAMRNVYLRHSLGSHYLLGDCHFELRKPASLTEAEVTRVAD